MASYSFDCPQCIRKFSTLRGLSVHRAQHSANKDQRKHSDPKYIRKSNFDVEYHRLKRESNPKKPFKEFKKETKEAINEAKVFENFLQEKFGLKTTSIEDKIKDYAEKNGSDEVTEDILKDRK